MPYIGALKAWVYYPIFKIFGISLLTIRLPVILFGALSIWFSYKYVADQFGKLAAYIFIALAVVEPSTIFHTRLDWGPTTLMMVFRGALLVALSSWFISGNKKYIIISIICCAFGIFDKLNFVWIASSALLSGVIIYPERFFRIKPSRMKTKSMIVYIGCFIAFILVTAVTLKLFGTILNRELGIFNFSERWGQFISLIELTLSGTGVYSFVIQGSNEASRYHSVCLMFLIAVSIIGIVIGLKNKFISSRSLFFLLCFILFLAIQIFFTKKATGPHHFATFAPLWLVLVAIGLASLINALRQKNNILGFGLGALSVALLLSTSILVDLDYHRGFQKNNINPFWDISSLQLTETMEILGKA